MKVRVEAKLTAVEGTRSFIRVIEMPAPPVVGLRFTGRGWKIEVERVSYAPDNGEYAASCTGLIAQDASLVDLTRIYEIDGWRVAAHGPMHVHE